MWNIYCCVYEKRLSYVGVEFFLVTFYLNLLTQSSMNIYQGLSLNCRLTVSVFPAFLWLLLAFLLWVSALKPSLFFLVGGKVFLTTYSEFILANQLLFRWHARNFHCLSYIKFPYFPWSHFQFDAWLPRMKSTAPRLP